MQEIEIIYHGQDISAPVIKVGTGPKKVAVLNGLHGLEKSGALLAQKVFQALPMEGVEVHLIPFANVPSFKVNSRNTPSDSLDLNRVFQGNENGTETQVMAHKIFEYLKGFDLVVDIHNFPKMKMPTVGVFFNAGSKEVKKLVLEYIYELGPDYIWNLDTSRDEKNKAGSLVESLLTAGVPAFALEAPDIELVTKEQIKRLTDGFVKVIGAVVTKKFTANERNQKIVERKFCLAKNDGIFEPKVEVGQDVSAGDEVGIIYDLESFLQNPVRAVETGVALFVLNNTCVTKGERVAVIGKETGISV